MNNLHQLEANIERLQARMPEAPAYGIMLSRMLMHLGRGMAAMLEQEIRPCGLAEAEFRVLATLFSQPDGVAHPNELCTRTSQSPANMSRIGDVLVRRGLIAREPSVSDRRKMILRITEKGEQLVRQLLPRLFGPLREMLEEFSIDEQQQLVRQLKRLGSKLDSVLTHIAEHRAP